MLKTIIVLPDGTELSSGVGMANAIQSVTITECVNDSQELALGSTCANMLEAKLITPRGGLNIAAGDEITVYKVNDSGLRHKIGLFTMEKPVRPSANAYSITAYDRVSWLDKDLTNWLAGLAGWPYSLYAFADMVCGACGLELANTEIPNGTYLVQQFSADGITGRQLMQWVGQIAGRFCRATVDGLIEFAWYEVVSEPSVGTTQEFPVTVTYDGDGNLSIVSEKISVSDDTEGGVSIDSDYLQVSDDGDGNVTVEIDNDPIQLYYYQNSLSQEDYTVAPIEKVQLRQNEEDVGTVYPNVEGEVNTYIITGNYLLTASTAEDLLPIAQTLYAQLKDVSYRPCKVSIPASLDIHAGSIVGITDRNGLSFTAYVMTKTTSGQKDTLECTGSHRRDSTTAVNSQAFKALSGKVLNLRTDVEGLKVENKDTAGNVAKISLEIENIKSDVSRQKSTADGIQSQLTSINQTASDISLAVKSIQDNGVSKVSNEFGLTIDESYVSIHRTGSAMTNRLDENGMYVVKGAGTSWETTMLKADADGVIATDVSVRNYLIIGSHARFEDYSNGTDTKRTACFYI